MLSNFPSFVNFFSFISLSTLFGVSWWSIFFGGAFTLYFKLKKEIKKHDNIIYEQDITPVTTEMWKHPSPQTLQQIIQIQYNNLNLWLAAVSNNNLILKKHFKQKGGLVLFKSIFCLVLSCPH